MTGSESGVVTPVARVPSVVSTGRFAGTPLVSMAEADLVAESRFFFRRDPVMQAAILSELRRRRGAGHPRSVNRRQYRRQGN